MTTNACGHASEGVVTMAAGEFLEGRSGAGRQGRYRCRHQQLVRLQESGEEAQEEIGGGYGVLATAILYVQLRFESHRQRG